MSHLLTGGENSEIHAASDVRGNDDLAARRGKGKRHRAARRLDLEAAHLASRRHFGESCREGGCKRRNALEDTAGKHRWKYIAAHSETRHDRGRCDGQLARGAIENVPGDGVARLCGTLHDGSERSNRVTLQSMVVDRVNELCWRRELHLFEHEIGQ